ncbi:hypothetical protein DIPPA_28549 [Diplonema papillatum]|nr:hypothetical protein DIPPA_28549 [Diplonema papillatum]
MNYFEETQVMFAAEADQLIVDDKDSSKRKDRLRAVVTRIGTEPLLKIEGGGEIRFAYRNVKKKHGDARPFIQVGDNVECRLTKSNPPKAVSVRLMKKSGEPADVMTEAKRQPARFVHDPYSVDPTTSTDSANIANLCDSPLLCDEIDAGDVDAAIDGCLSGDHQINGLCDYYPSSYKKVADDSCLSMDKYCANTHRCRSAPVSYNDELMMLTAYDYGY